MTGRYAAQPISGMSRYLRARLAAVGIFGRKSKPEHSAAVIYVFDKHGDYPPYYCAVCRCGWSADPVDAIYPDLTAEMRVADAARSHDPAADTTVGFPLDDPPNR